MKAQEQLTDDNEHYYPEMIIVFGFILLVGCVIGLVIGITCTRAIPW